MGSKNQLTVLTFYHWLHPWEQKSCYPSIKKKYYDPMNRIPYDMKMCLIKIGYVEKYNFVTNYIPKN